MAAVAVSVLKYRSRDHIKFAELDMTQIESILLYAYAGQTAVLSEQEALELIPLLNKVELAGEWTQEFRDYTGQYRMFQIHLRNGKSFDFAANTPMYIIDGERGYKAEGAALDACYALGQRYYELVDLYFY